MANGKFGIERLSTGDDPAANFDGFFVDDNGTRMHITGFAAGSTDALEQEAVNAAIERLGGQ